MQRPSLTLSRPRRGASRRPRSPADGERWGAFSQTSALLFNLALLFPVKEVIRKIKRHTTLMRLKTKVQPVDMDKIVKRGVNAVKGVTGIGKKDEPAQQQQPAPTGEPPEVFYRISTPTSPPLYPPPAISVSPATPPKPVAHKIARLCPSCPPILPRPCCPGTGRSRGVSSFSNTYALEGVSVCPDGFGGRTSCVCHKGRWRGAAWRGCARFWLMGARAGHSF